MSEAGEVVEDPNEMLEWLRKSIARYHAARAAHSTVWAANEAIGIVDNFTDLDAYLRDGGSLPAAWMPGDDGR